MNVSNIKRIHGPRGIAICESIDMSVDVLRIVCEYAFEPVMVQECRIAGTRFSWLRVDSEYRIVLSHSAGCNVYNINDSQLAFAMLGADHHGSVAIINDRNLFCSPDVVRPAGVPSKFVFYDSNGEQVGCLQNVSSNDMPPLLHTMYHRGRLLLHTAGGLFSSELPHDVTIGTLTFTRVSLADVDRSIWWMRLSWDGSEMWMMNKYSSPKLYAFDTVASQFLRTVTPDKGDELWPTMIREFVVDRANRVWLLDEDGHRMMVFDSNGQFLCSVGTDVRFVPRDVCLDNQGRVYVMGTRYVLGNERTCIRVFQ